MKSSIEIQLSRLRFRAYHGLHEGEDKVGNEFEVNVSIWCYATSHISGNIADTVDYAAAYNIVSQHMAHPVPLLETVADGIAREIIAKFPAAEKTTVSVSKLQPPIARFSGAVGVVCTINRNE